MRKYMIVIGILFFFGKQGFGQCDPQIPQNNINVACSTLATLMDCHLKTRQYEKALAVYIFYRHINDEYSPPDPVKKYFSKLPPLELKKLARLRLSLQGSAAGSEGNSSPMPEIIIIKQ